MKQLHISNKKVRKTKAGQMCITHMHDFQYTMIFKNMFISSEGVENRHKCEDICYLSYAN